jgi:hypothetical protein
MTLAVPPWIYLHTLHPLMPVLKIDRGVVLTTEDRGVGAILMQVGSQNLAESWRFGPRILRKNKLESEHQSRC